MKHASNAGILLLGLLGSCNPSHNSIETQAATLGGFSYEAPAHWKRVDAKAARSVVSTWTPDDNDNKESIVVIRTAIDASLAQAGVDNIKRQLVAAQQELPKVELTSPASDFRTRHGMTGVRLEDDFVPSGQQAHYHRAHAVLLDGVDLVHVLYTARTMDADEGAFQVVINSMQRGEG